MISLGKLIKAIVLLSSFLYITAVFLLLLNRDVQEARNGLKSVDASLGVYLPPVHLASEGCGLSDFKSALFDVHVLSHFLGWFITILALRDVAFCWVCGAVWEIMEITISNNIPELVECWWDKIFLDLLGANNLGIFLGWMVMRYFKMEEFNWVGTITENGKELHSPGIFYFIPGGKKFIQNQYGVLKTERSAALYLYFLFLIVILQIQLFFIKTALWIPTLHWFCYYRSFVIGSLVTLSAQIFKQPDLTFYPLLLNLALFLEACVTLKFGSDLLFSEQMGGSFGVVVMVVSFALLGVATLRDAGRLIGKGMKLASMQNLA